MVIIDLSSNYKKFQFYIIFHGHLSIFLSISFAFKVVFQFNFIYFIHSIYFIHFIHFRSTILQLNSLF